MADDVIGPKGFGRAIEKAEADEDARRPRRAGGLDVIDAVADEGRAPAAALRDHREDRFGRRFADAESIAADNDGHTVGEAKCSEQRARHAFGFVRHDRGAHTELIEPVERVGQAGEGAAVHRDMRFIIVQQVGKEALDGAIRNAARRALADEVIDALPGGYDQLIGRRFKTGVDLSGGQWQKIAIARAYMRDAQVMILDEPTAALDARSEFEVFQRFKDLSEGRTAVLISHRFSSVRMADRILVLANGKVEASGTHAQLMAQGGRYAELFELQAAGYR